MQDGFVKVAACGFEHSLADTKANAQKIKALIDRADEESVNLMVLPELCLTGYTCGDLFNSQSLRESALKTLLELADYSSGKYSLIVVGLPLTYNNRLYNCSAVLHDGKILGIVPKLNILNHGEFYEKRYFTSGLEHEDESILIDDLSVPFGSDLIFRHAELENYSFALEIGSDISSPFPPASRLATAGATIIANPAAGAEYIGSAENLKTILQAAALRNICAYIHSGAGKGESTGDLVFSGRNMIIEYSKLLAEDDAFAYNDSLVSVIDTNLLANMRLKTAFVGKASEVARKIYFKQKKNDINLQGRFSKTPFVPEDEELLAQRAESVLEIQAHGLERRLTHIGSKKILIGVSGGLDSTWALIAAIRALKLMERPNTDILALSMPCFGTSDRTKNNAEKLCRLLGVSYEEIDITPAVLQHFKDLGHDENIHDITFENSQARERTQILMDMANKVGGMVLGTGDLSELALGWATYNGDHMSMYAINAGVPKTLMKKMLTCQAQKVGGELAEVLSDIAATPVSPELLPSQEGGLTQLTEEQVGPYQLQDFFLYHLIRHGFGPAKVFRMAEAAFADDYDSQTIKKWLTVFIRRFFSQQFKRSCLPDGPKIGTVNLSPRGDWRMPSDALAGIWLRELENLS